MKELAAFVVPAAKAADAGRIHDIEGPVPPAVLPPFTLTAAFLLLALAAAVVYRRYAAPVAPSPLPYAPPAASPLEELRSLRELCLAGKLPETAFFDRFTDLLRCSLPVANGGALTSSEVVAATRETLDGDRAEALLSLLELCDMVRFGGGDVGKGSVATAMVEAIDLFATFQERRK